MSKKKITPKLLKEKVLEVAAEKPDYRYGDDFCVYFDAPADEGEWYDEVNTDCSQWAPSCIMGHALQRIGFNAEDVESHNDDSISTLLTFLGCRTLAKDSVSFSSPTVFWLSKVQGYQDNKHPWGEAVKLADADLKNYKSRLKSHRRDVKSYRDSRGDV